VLSGTLALGAAVREAREDQITCPLPSSGLIKRLFQYPNRRAEAARNLINSDYATRTGRRADLTARPCKRSADMRQMQYQCQETAPSLTFLLQSIWTSNAR